MEPPNTSVPEAGGSLGAVGGTGTPLMPNTSVDVNVATLRATYDGILTSFGQTLGGILTDAQQAFDQLVATAQPKQKKNEKDDDEDEADDD